MTGPKQNGREEAGAWRRLLFSKIILCAEQTAETNAKCRPGKSHLIFCGRWSKNGVNLTGPGAAEAVKPAGKVRRVKVIGLGLPNENRGHMNECVTDTVILGMAEDLGNLTVYAARSLATGSWKPGDQTCQAGKLGEFAIQGDNILLGSPCFSTKANIDQFDF